MPYVITEACISVKDKSCVDVCPVDCIYEGEDQLYIHPDECIDCGACEPECPVTAIFPEEDVPVQLKSFIGKNKEFITVNEKMLNYNPEKFDEEPSYDLIKDINKRNR